MGEFNIELATEPAGLRAVPPARPRNELDGQRRVLVKRRKSVQQHPQDHPDDAAGRDGAVPGDLQPRRRPRPFTDKLAELVADLGARRRGLDHPLLEALEPGRRPRRSWW